MWYDLQDDDLHVSPKPCIRGWDGFLWVICFQLSDIQALGLWKTFEVFWRTFQSVAVLFTSECCFTFLFLFLFCIAVISCHTSSIVWADISTALICNPEAPLESKDLTYQNHSKTCKRRNSWQRTTALGDTKLSSPRLGSVTSFWLFQDVPICKVNTRSTLGQQFFGGELGGELGGSGLDDEVKFLSWRAVLGLWLALRSGDERTRACGACDVYPDIRQLWDDMRTQCPFWHMVTWCSHLLNNSIYAYACLSIECLIQS